MRKYANGISELVSNSAIAEELGISSRAVVAEVKRLGILYRYVGGLYLFDREAFMEGFLSEDRMRCCGRESSAKSERE